MAGEYVNPNSQLQAANWIQTRITRVSLCAAAPETYAEIAALKLMPDATVSIASPTLGGSPPTETYTITIPQATGTANPGSPTLATHIALHNNSDTLCAVAKITNPQTVSNGNSITVQSFNIVFPGAIQT